MQFFNFGDGRDGAIGSGVINAYASCTGTAGSNTVTSSLSVSVGMLVLLHQTQGSGANNFEVVKVQTPGSGSFTIQGTLVNSYTTGAQAVSIPQYNSGNLSGGMSSTAWNGSYGGIITFAYNSKLFVTSNVDVSSAGFRGASNVSGGGTVGRQGEGTPNFNQSQSTSANGNGGGGGGYSNNNPWNQGNAGGGGGNGASGAGGRGTGGGNNVGGGGGSGGSSSGTSDGISLGLGGGGGSGGVGTGNSGSSGGGANGGGLVIIFAKEIDVTAGFILANGGTGGNCVYPLGAGGGGAGGSILIFAQKADIGTNRLQANGGIGGYVGSGGSNLDGRGGPGSGGRIIVNACVHTGSGQVNGNDFSVYGGADNNPTSSAGTFSAVDGGRPYCGSGTVVI